MHVHNKPVKGPYWKRSRWNEASMDRKNKSFQRFEEIGFRPKGMSPALPHSKTYGK